ncbi:protein mitoshell isoform X1 [Zeugodacus cucurbitae]|uniref:Microtubule-associated protein 1A n=2 Tax=Zeugodacus cucurbitae TaxID=28588 RepID=A0A0A1XKE7_ZEUCU|nr:protein mitoshell isoform X1 [Zeugodacus cucurbitae]
MNEQQQIRVAKRQPRKILGINSHESNALPGDLSGTNIVLAGPNCAGSLPVTLQPSEHNADSLSQQPPAQPHTLNGGTAVCAGASVTTTTVPTSIALSVQHQQQMERLRLANMMNQEMHALWPYGTATFLSPMLPAPNMALPYALAGTLPYAAVPIYPAAAAAAAAGMQQNMPNAPQQCNNISPISTANTLPGSGASSASTSSATSSSGVPTMRSQTNDSNKINIQIGLQCVSQNSPLNFNSMNEINASLAKVNLLNFCGGVAEKENKETSSLRSSPILLSSDDLNNSSGICNSNALGSGAGGDATNATNSPGSGGSCTVTLSQAKFNELTRLALRGSEIAEKLAYTHRNRPCFKKIDSLCARMKQDLIRPDGVLPNINSQGIAWAVKDFIFVFTRVINAWIIIKGYVYNTPEGLNKVKSALSPDFAASFAAWQDTTMDFVENLIKSFVNLDNLVQSQKNVYQNSENNGTRAAPSTTPIKLLQPVNSLIDDSFDFLNTSTEKSTQNALNKNYLYTMVEDSEGSQRQATVNGTYFKTGTYNPIKKDALLVDQINNVTTSVTSTSATSTAAQHLLANNNPLEQYFDEQISEFWPPTADVDTAAAAEYLKIKEKIPPNWLSYDIRVLEQNLTEFSNDYDPNAPPRPLGKDLIDKLNVMIERLMAMKNAELFFKLQFTKNYFPEFMTKHKHDFMDVRSIILKCQVGGYQHIFEVVHDVKKIVHTGKEYLKFNVDNKLQKSISAFESEFNKLLSEPPFENYQFEHITGEPKEMLYNCRNK